MNVFNHLVYDACIFHKNELHAYKNKCGVYCLQVNGENLYVGASRNLGKRISVYYQNNGVNLSKKMYHFLHKKTVLGIVPSWRLTFFVRIVSDEFQLPELEVLWIDSIKPRLNGRMFSYSSRLLN
jgi:excinuclease UvrABC nuclease subunit